MAPLLSKVAALQEHPRPRTGKELQGFLGVINFYHHFISRAGGNPEPLMNVLMGNEKLIFVVQCSKSMKRAFVGVKALMLVHQIP